MKKIARAEKNKNNGLLPLLASLSRQRTTFWFLCYDRELWFSVVTETLGSLSRQGAQVLMEPHAQLCMRTQLGHPGTRDTVLRSRPDGPARATKWPCAHDRACAWPTGEFYRDKECSVATVMRTRPGLCACGGSAMSARAHTTRCSAHAIEPCRDRASLSRQSYPMAQCTVL